MSEFAEHSVRIETLIYLPGALVDEEAHPESFQGFCETLPEREDAELYAQLPALAKFATGDDYPECDEVAYALSRTPGFLVQAAAPVRQWGPSGHQYYSWGHYHTAWLYAEDVPAIERVCVAWAAERKSSDKAEHEARALA